jgi:hypothetical protein
MRKIRERSGGPEHVPIPKSAAPFKQALSGRAGPVLHRQIPEPYEIPCIQGNQCQSVGEFW